MKNSDTFPRWDRDAETWESYAERRRAFATEQQDAIRAEARKVGQHGPGYFTVEEATRSADSYIALVDGQGGEYRARVIARMVEFGDCAWHAAWIEAVGTPGDCPCSPCRKARM